MDSPYRRRFDVAMIALVAAAAATVAIGLDGPVRWLLVFGAVLLVPGAAVVPLLHLDDLAAYVGLTVVISLGIATVGAMLMIWAGWWHPLVLGAVVAIASCAALLHDLRDATRPAVGVAP